jgi:hypothetical protein
VKLVSSSEKKNKVFDFSHQRLHTMPFSNAFRLQILFLSFLLIGGCIEGGDGAPAGAAPNNQDLVDSKVCAKGVTTGYRGDQETLAANSGVGANSDSGADASAGDDGGSSGAGDGASVGGGFGKVLGGLVKVQDLSNGSIVGQALTDPLRGLVTVKTCASPGPFLLTIQGQPGAKYYDEGLDGLVEFGTGRVFHALVDKWDVHVGVSPLTEAAFRFALNNYKQDPTAVSQGRSSLLEAGDLTGLTAAQVGAANTIVRNQVNSLFRSSNQLSTLLALPTPIDSSTQGDLRSNVYGLAALINGGLAKAAGFYNPRLTAPALDFANAFARDLTDGVINGFALDGSSVSASLVATYESVRAPVSFQVGADAIAQRFAARTFGSGPLVLNERGFFGTDNSNSCLSFIDNSGLLSDGSVAVYRTKPKVVGGICNLFGDTVTEPRISRFITNVKQLVTGSNVAFAVKTDGTVVGWGSNTCGSISGLLPEGIYQEPQLVSGLRNITSLAVATNIFGSTVLARDETGRVFQFGRVPTHEQSAASGNSSNCISNGLASQKFLTPQLIPSLSNVSKLAAQNSNFAAILADGRVITWGESSFGVLGNGTTSATGQPQFSSGSLASSQAFEVTGLRGARDVLIYGSIALAVLADGSVKGWGSDSDGLLGGGVSAPAAAPRVVPGLSNIVKLAGNFDSNRIRMLRRDGAVIIWGDYINGGASNLTTPTVVQPVEKVRNFFLYPSGMSFFFESGRVGFDYSSTEDDNISFR